MVPQEGAPVLVRGRGRRCGFRGQVALDGALADLDAHLEEFAADAFGAPGAVRCSHLLDQGDGFGCDPCLRRLGLGLPPPDEAEQLTMPAEKGVGLDDEKGLSPERPCPGQEKEPQSVTIAELRAFGMALQDDQLVPQEGVLGDELGLAADGILGGSCKQRDGVGLEHLLDALTHVADGVENVRSEAMENVDHAVKASGI